MNTLQTLSSKMQDKGYLKVAATITEREWIDTPAQTFNVEATRTGDIVEVHVNGKLQTPEDAARWILKVVNTLDASGKRMQFQPVTTESIDLAETTLSLGEAHQFHRTLGEMNVGTGLRINQKELASRVTGRTITSFTEIKRGEMREIMDYLQAAIEIHKRSNTGAGWVVAV